MLRLEEWVQICDLEEIKAPHASELLHQRQQREDMAIYPWKEEVADGQNTGRLVSGKTVHFKKLLSQKKEKTFEGGIFLVDDPSSEYGPGYKLAIGDDKAVLGSAPDAAEMSPSFPWVFPAVIINPVAVLLSGRNQS